MIIAVDFDGTITEDMHDWWKIGKLLPGAKEVLTALHERGETLVLWTLRDQIINQEKPHWRAPQLIEALGFLDSHGLNFFKLPSDFKGYTGKKFFFDVVIDDRNIGGFPGWKVIADYFQIKL